MKAKEIFRWATVFVFGALGVYLLADSRQQVSSAFAVGGWLMATILVLCMLPFAGIPWIVSYLAWRRRYHQVNSVLAFIAAVILWGALFSLGRLFDSKEPPQMDGPNWILFKLPYALLLLYGPFYAARWFYRRCMLFADRYFPNDPIEKPPPMNGSPS